MKNKPFSKELFNKFDEKARKKAKVLLSKHYDVIDNPVELNYNRLAEEKNPFYKVPYEKVTHVKFKEK